ncbi:MAG TPA: sensor histidine kinase [Egibacteraceae bacterium]
MQRSSTGTTAIVAGEEDNAARGNYRADVHLTERLREEYHELPPWAFDGALALATAVVEMSALWLRDATAPDPVAFEGPKLQAVVLALLVSLPLTWRRIAPTVVFAVVGAAAVVGQLMDVPLQLWGLLVAAYSVAAHAERTAARAVLAVSLLGAVALLVFTGAGAYLPVTLVVVAAAWVTGDRQRTRRAYTRELELRAEQLERERENRARIAVAEERARIARELHDVVAHSVSVMVVQASAAQRALRRDPDRSEEALEQVAATGRQSLVELRRLLGLLRGGSDDTTFAPQPRFAEVDALVEQFRDAGLEVTLEVEGTPRPLSSGVDLSAYRIVQEALTNALKHAGPARVTVHVRYGADVLDITVDDDGGVVAAGVPAVAQRPSRDGGPGHGLVGMRERAALVGGELEVGPRPDGGYRVHARLPLGE